MLTFKYKVCYYLGAKRFARGYEAYQNRINGYIDSGVAIVYRRERECKIG